MRTLHKINKRLETLYRNNISIVGHEKARGNESSEVEYDDDWLVISNGLVNRTAKVRGSFDFFKTSLIEKMGGSFDMSRVELDRTGETDNMGMGYYGNSTPQSGLSMKDWEKPIQNFHGFMYDNELLDRIRYLAPTYRISKYCLEGERGLLSNTSTPQGRIYRDIVDNFEHKGLLNV